MESAHHNEVSFGGFFVNNFKHLRDLEGTEFRITPDDIQQFCEIDYYNRVGGPADLLAMKIENIGYHACSDGKSMVISPRNIHEMPVGHAYLGFSMSVQLWLYELMPSFLTQSGVIVKMEPMAIEKAVGALFRISDGILFLDPMQASDQKARLEWKALLNE